MNGNGSPSPGSPTPRLAKSVLVDVDMASSGRRSSPDSPNSTLGEEDPFPGPWKPLLCHFSAHHAVLFQFVKNVVVVFSYAVGLFGSYSG